MPSVGVVGNYVLCKLVGFAGLLNGVVGAEMTADSQELCGISLVADTIHNGLFAKLGLRRDRGKIDVAGKNESLAIPWYHKIAGNCGFAW